MKNFFGMFILAILFVGCIPNVENPEHRNKYEILEKKEVLKLEKSQRALLVLYERDSLRVNELLKFLVFQNTKSDNIYYRDIIRKEISDEIYVVSENKEEILKEIKSLNKKIRYHRGDLNLWGYIWTLKFIICAFIIFLIRWWTSQH